MSERFTGIVGPTQTCQTSVSTILNRGHNLTLNAKITSIMTDCFIVLELSTVRRRLFYMSALPLSAWRGSPPFSGAVLNLPAMLHNGGTEPDTSVADAGWQ